MEKQNKSLETQLFDYEEWDSFDFDMTFYDITLKRDLGEFKAGKKFSHCYWVTRESYVEFFDNIDDENGVKFKLTVTADRM